MTAALIATGENSHLNSYYSSKNERLKGRGGRGGGNARQLLGVEIQVVHTKHGK